MFERFQNKNALVITFIYLCIGCLWELFFDELILKFTKDPYMLTKLNIISSWIYILLSAWLLYFLIKLKDTRRDHLHRLLSESEFKYQSLIDESALGVYIFQNDRLVYVNPQFADMFGYTQMELQNLSNIFDLFPQHVQDRVKHNINQKIAGDKSALRYQVEGRTKGGRIIYLDAFTKRISYQGSPAIIGSVVDITEQKLVDQKIVNIIESMNDAFFSLDKDWRFSYLNQPSEILLEKKREDLIGKNVWEEFPEARNLNFFTEYHKAFKERVPVEFQTYYPPLDKIFEVRAFPSIDGGITVIYRDITERQKYEEKIHHLAFHDSLTNLPNRILFKKTLQKKLDDSKSKEVMIAVMFIDFDRFKQVNDLLGHDIGDLLLQEIAKRLKSCVRSNDMVARMGGDEFTILLPGVFETENARTVAQKIIDAFKHPFNINSNEIYITPSIGISISNIDGTEADTLIKRADTAMYYAKELGRNTYQFFKPEMEFNAIERMLHENELRNAITNQEFQLVYQPKINLETGRMNGIEALLRWQHPEKGEISPAKFIPLAEETGLINSIGSFSLLQACKQNKEWQLAGYSPVCISVNISTQQLKHPDFIDIVLFALNESKLHPKWLELEITESSMMEDVNLTIDKLTRLKKLGVTFSIDDFGTGYSSLNYLKELPINTLKIDQSFVRDIPSDRDDIAIIEAIISLAHSLELNVIAEGVETEEQLALLREKGCDDAQGYLLGRPVSSGEIFNWLIKA
jgi:diguanylate cyclase (GGDEF)-like protein/PAS domain S-box-containing protein